MKKVEGFPTIPLLSLIIVLLIGGLGYGFYEYRLLEASNTSLKTDLAEATSTIEAKIAENTDLSTDLSAEKGRNNEFQDQIESITGTVTKIDKLQQTDPQVLAKYSKVYFLPDTYIPRDLADIDASMTYGDGKKYQLIRQAEEQLERMIDDAKDDEVDLLVISAYRSFGAQAALKTSYKVTYGSGANAFSADQGYSEHQLGTTIDFTTKQLGADFSSFEATKAYTWLNKNAYRFGFVLSYPKGNGYYVFEPWHWRYAGLSLAEDLHDKDKYFYQLDQRAINEYLLDFANER